MGLRLNDRVDRRRKASGYNDELDIQKPWSFRLPKTSKNIMTMPEMVTIRQEKVESAGSLCCQWP
jgi:hypothetical protein